MQWVPGVNPLRAAVPFFGTNHSNFTVVCPQIGTAVLNESRALPETRLDRHSCLHNALVCSGRCTAFVLARHADVTALASQRLFLRALLTRSTDCSAAAELTAYSTVRLTHVMDETKTFVPHWISSGHPPFYLGYPQPLLTGYIQPLLIGLYPTIVDRVAPNRCWSEYSQPLLIR